MVQNTVQHSEGLTVNCIRFSVTDQVLMAEDQERIFQLKLIGQNAWKVRIDCRFLERIDCGQHGHQLCRQDCVQMYTDADVRAIAKIIQHPARSQVPDHSPGAQPSQSSRPGVFKCT